jgi:hypothetical protein
LPRWTCCGGTCRSRRSASWEDRDIGADGEQVPTLVVAAREDLEIAREVRRVLTAA